MAQKNRTVFTLSWVAFILLAFPIVTIIDKSEIVPLYVYMYGAWLFIVFFYFIAFKSKTTK